MQQLCSPSCYTVKLGYNEHAWDRQILFVIAVIRYNREDLFGHLGSEISTLILRYSREFVITVIVITEFDCIYSWINIKTCRILNKVSI
jgi:hypothetical protein